MSFFPILVLLNHQLSHKLTLIGRDIFNYLIISLTLPLTYRPKLSFNRWDSTHEIFNLN
jgi:hypothetical protein